MPLESQACCDAGVQREQESVPQMWCTMGSSAGVTLVYIGVHIGVLGKAGGGWSSSPPQPPH